MIIQSSAQNQCYHTKDRERQYPTQFLNPVEARDDFEQDYSQIIISSSFRRLQSKTQVIGSEVGDFHRTRLTHSLEVAQIARRIVIHLNAHHERLSTDCQLDVSLLEAASLAHDLGHPPFGHHGEQALHRCMKGHGGFEGNAQTLRILTKIEKINPTRALLLTVMKYPIRLDKAISMQIEPQPIPPKASIYEEDTDIFDWVLQPFTEEERLFYLATQSNEEHPTKTLHKSWECSILELADDIAYGTHDLEDAIKLGFVSMEQMREILAPVQSLIPDWNRMRERSKHTLKKVFASLVTLFIQGIQVRKNPLKADSPRLQYQVHLDQELRQLLDQLNQIVLDQVIHSQAIQTMNWKGKHIVEKLFQAFMNEEKLLPENDRSNIRHGQAATRVVCDYIAGMTDSYAMRMYARLFGQIGGGL